MGSKPHISAVRSETGRCRQVHERAAKSQARLTLPYFNSQYKSEKQNPTEEEVLNFFGCYSDEKFEKAMKKMKSGDEVRGVGRNHPWSKRFEELKGLKFTHDIRLRPSKIHGSGLFSFCNIEKDEIIMEYTGELITLAEADVRELKYAKQGIQESYFAQLGNHHVLDGTYSCNIAKYVNHSCHPNSILEIIKIQKTQVIVISAIRPIRPGQEITYDYKFLPEKKNRPCLCKSSRCRGFINQISEE